MTDHLYEARLIRDTIAKQHGDLRLVNQAGDTVAAYLPTLDWLIGEVERFRQEVERLQEWVCYNHCGCLSDSRIRNGPYEQLASP